MPRGRVLAFNKSRGHGTVVDDENREWFFHAVEIADGTRRIEADTPVSFDLVPGLVGRWEAVSVRAIEAQDSSD